MNANSNMYAACKWQVCVLCIRMMDIIRYARMALYRRGRTRENHIMKRKKKKKQLQQFIKPPYEQRAQLFLVCIYLFLFHTKTHSHIGSTHMQILTFRSKLKRNHRREKKNKKSNSQNDTRRWDFFLSSYIYMYIFILSQPK